MSRSDEEMVEKFITLLDKFRRDYFYAPSAEEKIEEGYLFLKDLLAHIDARRPIFDALEEAKRLTIKRHFEQIDRIEKYLAIYGPSSD